LYKTMVLTLVLYGCLLNLCLASFHF
jgi:hypothetical protein